MGKVGELIEGYKDQYKYRPSNSDIARELGVTRSTVGNWADGSTMPTAANMHALAELLGLPYLRVLDAALSDSGYLPREREDDVQLHRPPMKSAAEDLGGVRSEDSSEVGPRSPGIGVAGRSRSGRKREGPS